MLLGARTAAWAKSGGSIQPVESGLFAKVENLILDKENKHIVFEGIGDVLSAGGFTSSLVCSIDIATVSPIQGFVISANGGNYANGMIYHGVQLNGSNVRTFGRYNNGAAVVTPLDRPRSSVSGVVFCYDYIGERASSASRLFIDGNETDYTSRSAYIRTGNDDDILFGNTNARVDIKSWRLYDRVLTDAEMAQNLEWYRSVGWIA